MMRQRDVAVRATDRFATRRALNVRGKPAAIEQQNHLPAVVQSPLHRLPQRSTQRPAPFAALSRFVPQIDRQHVGHRPIEYPPQHRDQPELTGLRPMIGLQRRRRRAEHKRHFFRLRPKQRHVASMVPRGRLLLERRFVLFVDHDHAQLRRRGKDCAPRTDDDLHVASRNLFPIGMAFAVAEMAMQLFNQVGSNAGYQLPQLGLLLGPQLEQTRHMSPWHDERVAFAEREGVAEGEGRRGGGNDGGGGAEGAAVCHDD